MGALPPIPGDWLHDAVPRALSKQFQTNPFQREGERQAGSSPSLLKDGTDLPGIPVQQSLGGTQGASPKGGRVGEKKHCLSIRVAQREINPTVPSQEGWQVSLLLLVGFRKSEKMGGG